MSQLIIDRRYKILRKLGAGAMGEVYKVLDLKDNQIRALKILSKEKTTSEAVQRFKREFKLLAELHHPNLCDVYDFGMLKDGRSYFTMEYIDGQNIFKATKNLSREQIYALIVQLCRALEYIHAKGLIHYDIKPSNILIETVKGRTGVSEKKSPIPRGAGSPILQAKLVDFGLAGEQQLKGGVWIKGTFPYIAPEVIKGLGVDHRADLYSLGVLLYEVFVHKHFPLEDKKSFASLLGQRFEWSSLASSKIFPGLPRKLAHLIIRLLAFEPADRLNRANEVIAEINKISGIKFKSQTEKTIEGYILSSRFVGRDGEMELLKSCCEKSQLGDGRFLLIKGDPGVGKSRLLKEFRIFLQLKRIYCFSGCASHDRQNPLEPFHGVFQEVLPYLGDKSILSRSDESRASLAVLLRIFPDLTSGRWRRNLPRLVPLEASQEKVRTFESLSFLIRSVARALGGVVILLEDLHWADDLSHQFLEYLGRNLAGCSVFICATTRKHELAANPVLRKMVMDLRAEKNLSMLELKPFDMQSLSLFLDSTITPASNSVELVHYLANKTGGNPYFIEEIMRTLLIERKISVGAHIDLEDVRDQAIPPTIQEIVLTRLRGLERRALQVAQFAAVILDSFEYNMMKRLTFLSDTDLSKIMWELKNKQILVEQDSRYRFYHATMREAINKKLKEKEKRNLNYRVGTILENMNQKDTNRVIEDLAHYFINAKDPKKGVIYGMQAADKSSERYANERAIGLYRSVLKLANGRDAKLRSLVLQKLARIEVRAGFFENGNDHYCEALGIQILTPQEKAGILKNIGDIYRIKAEYIKALVCYGKALKLLTGMSKTKYARLKKASICSAMAFAYQVTGHYQRSRKYNIRTMALLRGLAGKEALWELGDVNYNLAVTNFYQGDYDAAVSGFQTAIKYFAQIKDQNREGQLLNGLGYIYFNIKSNHDRAVRYYKRAMRIFEKTANPDGLSAVLINLGLTFESSLTDIKALEFFQRAASISRRIDNKRNLAVALYETAVSLTHLSDYKKAEEHCLKALSIWKRVGKKEDKAFAMLGLSDIYREIGEYSKAYLLNKKALKIFREVNDQNNIASARARLSLFYISIGQFSHARRNIAEILRIAEKHNLKKHRLDISILLSQISLVFKDTKEAYACYREGVGIAKELPYRTHSIDASVILAEIYYLEKKYPQSIEVAEKIMTRAKQLSSNDAYIRILVIKAQSETARGILSEAKVTEIFEEARVVAEKKGAPELLCRVYYAYGHFLQGQEQYLKALEYYQKCNIIFNDICMKIRNAAQRRAYLDHPERRAVFAAISEIEKLLGSLTKTQPALRS